MSSLYAQRRWSQRSSISKSKGSLPGLADSTFQNYFLCGRWLYLCYMCELLFEIILYQHKTVINLHKLGIYVIWLSNPIRDPYLCTGFLIFLFTINHLFPDRGNMYFQLFNALLTIKYHLPQSRPKLFLYLLILALKSNFMQMIYILMLI